MSKNLNLLAFDLGASNGRAILGKYDGKKLHLDEIHKFSNGPEKVSGSLYWDVLRFFKEIKKGLQAAADKTGNGISSLGIDTWGVDYALLDKSCSLISNPYHYRDSRTEGLLDEILDIIPPEEIYEATGIQFMQLNTLVQLYADLKYRPWLLKEAESLLFIPDLLNFFMTGKKYNEYTIASTSQFYNPLEDRWVDEILSRLNLPAGLTQDIIHPGSIIGNVTDEVMEDCGLTGKIKVVAVGSHDTASAIAATPLEDREKSIYISSGTWSLLGMELDRPVINKESLGENFTNECGVGRKITFLKNLSGLWLIQECKRIWNKDNPDLSYQQISREAGKAVSNRFVLDPDDPSFLNPDDMPAAIRDYCKKTEQYIPCTYGEMARGIYESLALNYHRVIKKLEKLFNTKIDTINMVGGGIRAELLCQFTADVTGKKVVAGPVEATATGNILAQLMAKGEIRDLEEGRALVKRSVHLKEYYPDR